MAPIRDGKKFERTEEQDRPLNPEVTSNTSKKTTNLDIDEQTVNKKQTKH